MLLSPLAISAALALGTAAPDDAYVLAWRGDLVEARAAAATAVAAAPTDPAALVVAACVELELNDVDRADAMVSRLLTVAPPPPEATVLRALIARRRRAPREPLVESLAGAWKSAERPDLAKGGVLRRLRDGHPFAERVETLTRTLDLERIGSAEAFLLSSVNPIDARREADALLLARDPERNTVATNLCAWRALTGDAARQAVLDSASAQLPDNGYVALERLMGGTQRQQTGAPLSEADLDAVAAAVRAPTFDWPTEVVRREIIEAARKAGARHPDLIGALGSPSCATSLAPAAFQQRIDATTDPALRARALDLEEALASRLEASGWIFDRMMAAVARTHAARARGDAMHAKSIREEADRWQQRLRSAAEASMLRDGWPLASVWREWDAAREVHTFEALVR